MNIKQAIAILETHQEWRTGARDDMTITPSMLTTALDIMISHFHNFKVLSDYNKINYNLIEENRELKNAINMYESDCVTPSDEQERRASVINGIIIGINMCMEMWAQGNISYESMQDTKSVYEEELGDIMNSKRDINI